MTKRTRLLNFRVSEEEREAIYAVAKKYDVPLGALIRFLVLNADVLLKRYLEVLHEQANQEQRQ